MKFKIEGYYTPTEDMEIEVGSAGHKWMCPIGIGDVLTKDRNGKTYTVHTGVCVFGLKIPENKLVYKEDTAHLVI